MEKNFTKVQENLEAWCSPPLEFPSKKVNQDYKERTRRIADAILLKKPDRVPLMPMWEFFYAKYAGYSCRDVMYNATIAEASVVKTITDLKANEYEALLNDPSDFMLRSYLPRVSGNLNALATVTPLRNNFAYFMNF